MSDLYLKLLQEFPPRPIHNEKEYEATQLVIDRLLDLPKLSTEESDYLHVLGTLLSEYEQIHESPIPDIYGVELLQVLITERGLRQKDLIPIFKTESIVSDILKGKRQLTVRHIKELGKFFNLDSGVFLPQAKNFQEIA